MSCLHQENVCDRVRRFYNDDIPDDYWTMASEKLSHVEQSDPLLFFESTEEELTSHMHFEIDLVSKNGMETTITIESQKKSDLPLQTIEEKHEKIEKPEVEQVLVDVKSTEEKEKSIITTPTTTMEKVQDFQTETLEDSLCEPLTPKVSERSVVIQPLSIQ